MRFSAFLFTAVLLLPSAGAAVWKSSPLLSVGDKLADEPTLQVQQIGETFWSPPDMLLAWVRVAPAETPDGWALVSIRQGKVKTLFREGKEVVSKYAAAGSAPIRVVHETKWYAATSVIPLRGHAMVGPFRWDGESLQPFMSTD
jgi:hypothetical protein